MITIIGAGRVGSAVAFLCGSAGLDNITLVSRDEKKAMGTALDISNTIPSNSPISIVGTSDYSKIKNSDVLVVTASVKTHQVSRSDIMLEQAMMIRDVARKISSFSPDSKVLVVTNPVDVMTYLIQKVANLASKNVLGVASSLDSSRFRYLLAKKLGTNQSQISNAMVMGEHDDSMVPIFSQAKFGNDAINELLDERQKSQISADVKYYWKSLRDHNVISIFGIAKNTFDIIEAIIQNKKLHVCASVLSDGRYGFDNVCLGIPITVTKNGFFPTPEVLLDYDEKEQLHKSADIVKNNITQVMEFLKSR